MGNALIGSLVVGGSAVIVTSYVQSSTFYSTKSATVQTLIKYGTAMMAAALSGTLYHLATGSSPKPDLK